MADDNDPLKPLPTRSGPAQGDSTERKMLAKAGGQDTIARVVRRNPDGSTTTLKTRGGMPHFDTVVPPQGVLPEEPPTVFIGIPCSHTHQGGYSPVSDPEKLVHEWAKWHKTQPPPNEHASTDSPKFKATHEYSVEATPGHHTWYSEQVKVARRSLVVSWKGPMWRSGHYASSALLLSGTHYPTYGDLSGPASGASTLSIPGKEFSTYLGAAVTHFTKALEGFSAAVWLNGVRCEVGNDVWAAAVRKPTESEPHAYLYYFDAYTLYRRKIKYRERKRGIERVPESPLLDEIEEAVATFSVTEFPDGVTPMTFTSYQLVQMPFINASCTKAVFLIMFCTDSKYWAPTLYEADFDTGELTLVVKSERVRQTPGSVTVNSSSVSPAPPVTDPYGNAYVPSYSASLSSNTTVGPDWYALIAPLAADYVGDDLEYLVSESAHGYKGRVASTILTESNTQSLTASTSGGVRVETFSYSVGYSRVMSETPGAHPALPCPAGIRLRSNLYGEVQLLSVPLGEGDVFTDSVSASGSGGRDRSWVVSPYQLLYDTPTNMTGAATTIVHSGVGHTVSSNECERVGIVDADLRSRTYVFCMFFACDESSDVVVSSPMPDSMRPSTGGAATLLRDMPGWPYEYDYSYAPGTKTTTYSWVSKHYYTTCVVAFGEVVFRDDAIHTLDWNDPSPYVVTASFPTPMPSFYPGNSSVTSPASNTAVAVKTQTILGAQFSPYDGFFYGTNPLPAFTVWGPRFTSLAISPPLKAGASQTGYVSVKFPDCNLLTGPEFHAFLRKRPGEPVETHPCNTIPYTPDASKRTIIRPLFLPTSLPT